MDDKYIKLFVIKQSQGWQFKLMPKMHQNTFGGRAPPEPQTPWPHGGLLLREIEGREGRREGTEREKKGIPPEKGNFTAVMDCRLRAGSETEWRETWWVVRHRSVWPAVSAAGRRRRPAGWQVDWRHSPYRRLSQTDSWPAPHRPPPYHTTPRSTSARRLDRNVGIGW